MQLPELAAHRTVMRYDPNAFEHWYQDLMEKAGHRVDPMAAHHMWERGYSIYDAMVKIVAR